MNCDIVRLDTASSIDLVGKISSPVSTEGSYQFIIEKQGPSGRSDIAQSGDFAVSSNESEEVGRVSLDMDPGAFYIAHLIVEWSGGQIDCHYDSRH